jgi:toxin YoeB
MVNRYKLVFTKQARKDADLIVAAGLKNKVQELLNILKTNPFEKPPPFEKLVGDLSGSYSRRINIKHRLVYQVLEAENAVKIIRLWSHYE